VKIAILTPYFYPLVGGVQEHVYNLYLWLKRHNYSVKIITSNFIYEDNKVNQEEDVIRLGKSIPFYINKSVAQVALPFKLFDKITQVLEKERFDIIHIHEPLAPTLPLFTLQ